MRQKWLSFLFAILIVATTAGSALANPSPPTNGGNGGGSSGQCTGSAHERPSGCHTSK